MTGINSLAGSETTKQYNNLLNEKQTDGDIGPIARVRETRKTDLMVCCRHCIPDYLVLEFGREVLEGGEAIDLVFCNGKYPSNKRCWERDKRWTEQYCWFLSPGN